MGGDAFLCTAGWCGDGSFWSLFTLFPDDYYDLIIFTLFPTVSLVIIQITHITHIIHAIAVVKVFLPFPYICHRALLEPVFHLLQSEDVSCQLLPFLPCAAELLKTPADVFRMKGDAVVVGEIGTQVYDGDVGE